MTITGTADMIEAENVIMTGTADMRKEKEDNPCTFRNLVQSHNQV